MVVGLQGSGKTTTVGKLARLLEKRGRRPMLVAADVYRPAAIEQLKVLGQQLNMPVYSEPGGSPPLICEKAHRIAAPTLAGWLINATRNIAREHLRARSRRRKIIT
jgi:signal recognition particle subunit SRP54